MLSVERLKKFIIMEKPKKDSVRERVEVRRAFFCAFSALPASSPSMPNSSASSLDFFFFLSCSPPAFRMASRGVMRLSFIAGSQAEKSTVKSEARMVTAKIAG